tara:strand:- start:49689 stop:52223 length:2535 start_codon:yes stop_codon:yes gene_type:complete
MAEVLQTSSRTETLTLLIKEAQRYQTQEYKKALCYAFEQLDGFGALLTYITAHIDKEHNRLLDILDETSYQTSFTPPLLQQLLHPETHRNTRQKISLLIGQQASSEDVMAPLLEALMTTDQDTATAKQAAWLTALAEQAHSESTAYLMTFLENNNQSDANRIIAAKGLAKQQHQAAIPVIQELLSNSQFYKKFELLEVWLTFENITDISEEIQNAYERLYGYDKGRLLESWRKLDPQGAIAQLGDELHRRHDEWTRRCDYVKMLAETNTPEARDILHRELLHIDEHEDIDDNEWYIRGEIAKTLGEQAHPDSLPFLEKAIWQEEIYDTSVLNAVKALAHYPKEDATPILINAFSRTLQNHSVLYEAARVLNTFGVVQPIIDLLQSDDVTERKRAAEALRFNESPKAIGALFDTLDDSEPQVADEVLTSLSHLKAKGLGRHILQRMQEGRHAHLSAWRIHDILGEYNVQEAIPLLLEELRKEEPSNIHTLVRTLTQLDAKQALPLIIEKLEQTDSIWTQEVLFEALLTFNEPTAAPHFRALFERAHVQFKDPDCDRYTVEKMLSLGLRGIQQFHIEGFQDELVDSLDASSWDVRGEALQAMAASKHPQLLDIMREDIQSSSNKFNTEPFMEIFHHSEDPAFLELLLDTLKGKDLSHSSAHYRRKDAARSCRYKIDQPGVFQALTDIMHDKDEDRDLRHICALSLTYDPPSNLKRSLQGTLLESFKESSFIFTDKMAWHADAFAHAHAPLSEHIHTLQQEVQQNPTSFEVHDELEELFVFVNEINQLFVSKLDEIEEYEQRNKDADQSKERDIIKQAKEQWAPLVDLLQHNVLERLQHHWEEVLFV